MKSARRVSNSRITAAGISETPIVFYTYYTSRFPRRRPYVSARKRPVCDGIRYHRRDAILPPEERRRDDTRRASTRPIVYGSFDGRGLRPTTPDARIP